MPRQGKNIYLRKDGRWESRYLKGKINGKTSYGYVFGKTHEEAEQKLRAIFAANPEKYVADGTDFEELSYEWLHSIRPELKASSYAKYLNLLNSYLNPVFGKLQIQSISRSEVLKFSRYMRVNGGIRQEGLSPKTVNSAISVLKSVLKYASREKGFQTASIGDVFVRQQQKPMRILTRNEQTILSGCLCADLNPCRLGILLCMYTGMRIGEICALQWKDVLLDEQYLFIHRSMQRIQSDDIRGKRTTVVIQTPKSGCSIRKIPIPNEILTLLIKLQKQKEAFLLTGTAHSFMEPRRLENQLKTIAAACGIYDVNFHALRHTFATRCVELGFDVKSLSEILGHSSVNITLNRYVHPSMELKQANMNRLSALLTIK